MSRIERGLSSDQSSCLVSVVIPTHNRPTLLRRAIRSVLSQSYHDIELLVVDDSPDGTALAVCEQFHDGRIRYLKNDHMKGACGSRNTGIYHAKGVFYAGLDDDDFFHRERIRVLQLAYRKEYSFVASNTEEMRDGGRSPLFRGERIITMEDILWANCVGNQIFSELHKVKAVGGFNEYLTAGQDRDLWVRMIENWGKALRVAPSLYGMDVSHGGDRITTTADTARREKDFVTIHRDKLTVAQRLVSQARIEKYNGRPYLLPTIGALCFPSSWAFFVKRAMKRL